MATLHKTMILNGEIIAGITDNDFRTAATAKKGMPTLHKTITLNGEIIAEVIDNNFRKVATAKKRIESEMASVATQYGNRLDSVTKSDRNKQQTYSFTLETGVKLIYRYTIQTA